MDNRPREILARLFEATPPRRKVLIAKKAKSMRYKFRHIGSRKNGLFLPLYLPGVMFGREWACGAT